MNRAERRKAEKQGYSNKAIMDKTLMDVREQGIKDGMRMCEEKINVNEYVRTDNGEIHKVIDVEKGSIKIKSQYKEWIGLCCIVKHSKQLIDLIEKDDYVNGYKVINVINEEPCPSGKCVDIDSSKDSSECTLWEEDIKTILTKESYMANCYKVGGE